MPTITKPSIPVATLSNIVDVVNAIRSSLIAQNNQGSSTTPATPSSSQFKVTNVQYRSVTFGTVTVPVLMSLTLVNTVTNETWTYIAPAAATSGGVVGSAL